MSQYNKLYTKEDSAIVFIDHQPQMLFGVEGINRASLINNVTLIAKAAKESASQPSSRPSKPKGSADTSGRNCWTCSPAKRWSSVPR
jgi:hypothetical protein